MMTRSKQSGKPGQGQIADPDAFEAACKELREAYPGVDIDRFVAFGLKRVCDEPWASERFAPEDHPENEDKRFIYIHAQGTPRNFAVIMFVWEKGYEPEIRGLCPGHSFDRSAEQFRTLVGLG
jgi:hypothetical protein